MNRVEGIEIPPEVMRRLEYCGVFGFIDVYFDAVTGLYWFPWVGDTWACEAPNGG